MGSIKKQPGSVNFQNSLTIKDLCLDVSCYFWLLWRSKYNTQTGKLVVAGYYDTNNNNKYDKTDKDEILIYDLKTLKLASRI